MALEYESPMRDTFVGFDSAWTDKATAPGAICAVSIGGNEPTEFHAPRLASFDEAARFISEVRSDSGCTLIALDQPTVVPNENSMRPVERVAASLISWLGGGVQPANRSKVGMFCDASPVWRFLSNLGATEDPQVARCAADGLYLVEVFPALALPSLDAAFFGRLARPRYNPARRKAFQIDHWSQVALAAAASFDCFELAEPAAWCRTAAENLTPKKADQDRLDAMVCLLSALYWRLRPRDESMMLGCLKKGYMIFPASSAVRAKLGPVAERLGVPAV